MLSRLTCSFLRVFSTLDYYITRTHAQRAFLAATAAARWRYSYSTCVKCAFSNRAALLLCGRLQLHRKICPIYVSNHATDSKTIALNSISRCTGNVCACVCAMPSLVHVTTKHTAFLAAPVCDRTMYTLYSDNVVFRRFEHFWSNCVVSHSSCPRVVHSRLYQINGHRDLSEHCPAVSS